MFLTLHIFLSLCTGLCGTFWRYNSNWFAFRMYFSHFLKFYFLNCWLLLFYYIFCCLLACLKFFIILLLFMDDLSNCLSVFLDLYLWPFHVFHKKSRYVCMYLFWWYFWLMQSVAVGLFLRCTKICCLGYVFVFYVFEYFIISELLTRWICGLTKLCVNTELQHFNQIWILRSHSVLKFKNMFLTCLIKWTRIWCEHGRCNPRERFPNSAWVVVYIFGVTFSSFSSWTTFALFQLCFLFPYTIHFYMTGKQVETATELVTSSASSFFCVPRLLFLYYDVVYLATMQTTHICAQVRIFLLFPFFIKVPTRTTKE